MSSFTIAPATLHDLNGLSALSIEVWLDTYAENGIPESYAAHVLSAYDPARFDQDLNTPDTHILVCRNDVGLLGYVKVSLNAQPVSDTSGIAEIATLYVRRHHQGLGLGKRLLDGAFDLARDAAKSKIFLTVYEKNTRAVAFYQRQGMQSEGSWTFDFEGGSVPNLIMTKALNC